MKNKIIIWSLALLMLLPASAMAKERQFKLTIKDQSVTINKEIGYPYINKDERTMVPIRVISENLGYQVDWNQENKIATIKKDDKLIALKNEKNFAVINNKKVPLGVKADGSWEKTSVKIKDDRTYVPLRFIAEAMNEKVDYRIDKDFHYINISDNIKNSINENNEISDTKNENIVSKNTTSNKFKTPDLVKQEGIKINRQLEVNRKSLDKPTQIKPYKVSVLGEYYEFDRNDPLLKDVTSQEYDGMEYKCDQNTSTKMQIWDGSDLYNPSIPIKSVEPRSVFLTSPKMYFTEAMGANEHNLAYFAPLYVELDNGVKVDMSAFSVKDTIAGTNGKKTNIWGRTVKRIIFQNRRNCFERLIINTNIQLPDSPPEEGIVFVSYVTGEMMDSNGNTNLE